MATGLFTPTHIAILVIVALLILGPKRLPQTGRALGTGIREFKDAVSARDVESIAVPNDDTRQEKGQTS